MTADGRRHQTLQMGQTVHISAAPYRLKLLAFNEGEFFEKLRDRLLWGARVNE
jgi:NAD kinase